MKKLPTLFLQLDGDVVDLDDVTAFFPAVAAANLAAACCTKRPTDCNCLARQFAPLAAVSLVVSVVRFQDNGKHQNKKLEIS